MSIRWKLFLTLFLVATTAIVLVLLVAEREFREWVKKDVAQRFDAQMRGLLKSRQERLEPLRATCLELADDPAVRASLQGEGTREIREGFIRRFLELRGRETPGGRGRGWSSTEGARAALMPNRSGANPRNSGKGPLRPGAGAGQALPVMGIIDMGGEVTHFGPAIAKRPKAQRARTTSRLRELSQDPEQRITYVVLPGEEAQRSQVQEVIVTPVRGKEDAVIGWFFLGIDAETRIERAFQQAEEASGRDGRSGLVVDGEWFVKGVSDGEAEAFTEAASEVLWMGGLPEVVEVEGKDFLLIAQDLNPQSMLGRGVQLVVFPLEELLAAVARLRGVVLALGGCAVLVSGLVAYLLAGRFSRPIAALLAGTERVRKGELGEEVPVRSKDEFGRLAGAFNVMTADLALKERYREVLVKVSDPAVAQRLMEGELELGGEMREAAVLFCDIRGFTAMTEGMDPREVIGLINEHMTAMTKLVYLHGGVVDKFVGDLIMAIFGVPTSSADDAMRAARCAIEMLEERRRLNEEAGPILEVGIGVAYGELVAGCMGSEDRLNYTVLGDRVNLASRLCSVAGKGEVIIDSAVADAVEGEMRAEPRDAIPLKGIKDPVETFRLKG